MEHSLTHHLFFNAFSDIDVKKYMADIGMVEQSSPLVRVLVQ